MNIFKKSKKSLLLLGLTIIFLTVCSLLSYFNILGNTSSGIICMIYGMIFSYTIGFMFGKKREKNGYIGGLIAGIVLVLIIFLLSLILGNKINGMMFIYYLVLMFSSILGGMKGINHKTA